MQKTRRATLLDATGARRVVDVPDGSTVADVLRRAGFALDFDCGGRGVCGRCVVRVAESADVAENGSSRFESRLACRTLVDREGLVVDVSNLSTFERKRAETVESPTFAPASESFALPETADGPPTPEERAGKLGLAADLGTTTVVASLVSLDSGRILATASRRNPQIPFGRDVVSRIAAASSSAETAATLRRVVVREIGALAVELTEPLGLRLDRIVEIVVAGNTVESFLFVDRDVSPLGAAPFDVGEKTFPEFAASAFDWGVSFADAATVRVFPVFSAFVGGDVLAGFEFLNRGGAFDDSARTVLFIDVGTNGETILASRGRYFSTSTAAGPAFEGSEISAGSLAVSGAIRAIRFAVPNDSNVPCWLPETVGGAPATSVCGSGLVDALAGALALNVVSPAGRLRRVDESNFGSDSAAKSAPLPPLPPELRSRLGTFGGVRAFRISNDDAPAPGVWLTQRDVRQVQLAVGAIRAGFRLLTEAAGVSVADLERVYLAGGFGASLNRTNARRIGLLPPEISDDRVAYCGNSSLFGAVGVLTKRINWAKVSEALDVVRNVDLASQPRFAEVFAESTRFPDAASFPPPASSRQPRPFS